MIEPHLFLSEIARIRAAKTMRRVERYGGWAALDESGRVLFSTGAEGSFAALWRQAVEIRTEVTNA